MAQTTGLDAEPYSSSRMVATVQQQVVLIVEKHWPATCPELAWDKIFVCGVGKFCHLCGGNLMSLGQPLDDFVF